MRSPIGSAQLTDVMSTVRRRGPESEFEIRQPASALCRAAEAVAVVEEAAVAGAGVVVQAELLAGVVARHRQARADGVEVHLAAALIVRGAL